MLHLHQPQQGVCVRPRVRVRACECVCVCDVLIGFQSSHHLKLYLLMEPLCDKWAQTEIERYNPR